MKPYLQTQPKKETYFFFFLELEYIFELYFDDGEYILKGFTIFKLQVLKKSIFNIFAIILYNTAHYSEIHR